MRSEFISSTLIKMANHRHLRKLLTKKFDEYIYKNMVTEDSEDLRKVAIKRYEFLSAMLQCIMRNVDRGYVSPEITKKIVNVMVPNNLITRRAEFHGLCPWVNGNSPEGRRAKLVKWKQVLRALPVGFPPEKIWETEYLGKEAILH